MASSNPSTPQRRNKHHAVEQEDEECAVCLEPLFDEENPGMVVQLPCRHRFHDACISRAMRYQTRVTLQKTATCPCCRHQLWAVSTEAAEGDLDVAQQHRAVCLCTCRVCFYAAFLLAFVVFLVLVFVLSNQASRRQQ